MTDKIEIRRASTHDALILASAERETADTPGLLISMPSELKDEAFHSKITELNQHSRGLYVVAVTNHRIVGHALLDPMDLSRIAHIVRLTIVVHPESRRQGVGRALMEYLVKWARSTEGVEKIELLVRSSNEGAQRLYKQFGFEEEGRLRRRIRLGDANYLDDICMGLWIK